LQTINEMRALEDMPPVPGGDEMAPAVEPPATKVQIVDPNARALEPLAELRTWDPPSPQEVRHDTHIHLPESVAVELRNEEVGQAVTLMSRQLAESRAEMDALATALASLASAVGSTPAPVVNVAPAEVTVNVPEQPAPIVNVAAPEVKVSPNVVVQMPEDKPSRKTVKYDNRGRVVEIVED
jgi:hypothetical protein